MAQMSSEMNTENKVHVSFTDQKSWPVSLKAKSKISMLIGFGL